MGKITYRISTLVLLLLLVLSSFSLMGCRKTEEEVLSCALLPVDTGADAPGLMALSYISKYSCYL